MSEKNPIINLENALFARIKDISKSADKPSLGKDVQDLLAQGIDVADRMGDLYQSHPLLETIAAARYLHATQERYEQVKGQYSALEERTKNLETMKHKYRNVKEDAERKLPSNPRPTQIQEQIRLRSQALELEKSVNREEGKLAKEYKAADTEGAALDKLRHAIAADLEGRLQGHEDALKEFQAYLNDHVKLTGIETKGSISIPLSVTEELAQFISKKYENNPAKPKKISEEGEEEKLVQRVTQQPAETPGWVGWAVASLVLAGATAIGFSIDWKTPSSNRSERPHISTSDSGYEEEQNRVTLPRVTNVPRPVAPTGDVSHLREEFSNIIRAYNSPLQIEDARVAVYQPVDAVGIHYYQSGSEIGELINGRLKRLGGLYRSENALDVSSIPLNNRPNASFPVNIITNRFGIQEVQTVTYTFDAGAGRAQRLSIIGHEAGIAVSLAEGLEEEIRQAGFRPFIMLNDAKFTLNEATQYGIPIPPGYATARVSVGGRKERQDVSYGYTIKLIGR